MKRSTRPSPSSPPPGPPSFLCCLFKFTPRGVSLQLAPWLTSKRRNPLVDCANTVFTRPLLLIGILLFSNYMGHFHPIVWTSTERPALLAPLLQPLLLLPALEGGTGRERFMREGTQGWAAERHTLGVPEPSSGKKGASSSSSSNGGAGGLSELSGSSSASEEESASGVGLTFHLEGGGENSGDTAVVTAEDAAVVSELVEGGSKTESAGGGASSGAGSAVIAAGVVNVPGFTTGGCENSPYVTCWRVSVGDKPSCRKLFPRHLIKTSQGPISFVGDLVRKRQRLLLTIPRHGLGNSLRGYVSSFVYSALSGRRLVRFHGAEHAKVYDTLCHSFKCGFEGIEADEEDGMGPMTIYKQLEHLNPLDLNSKRKSSAQILSSLRSTQSLFISKSPHFFDGFWRNFPTVERCIYEAFGCSSTWCVRSRAIHALIGPPTPLLKGVITKVLRRHVASGSADVAANVDTTGQFMFDVALHFRTRPAAIESKHPGEGEGGRTELMRIGCGKQDPDAGQESQFLKGCLWNCLGDILGRLRRGKGSKHGLDVLLATDNEALRPAFVDRLAPFGTVYYSSGVIVHSSKSASLEAERLPTMAEFHLMSRSHMILEAGSYISTFAYFSGLLGNGTLAGIEWLPSGKCSLKTVHKGEMVKGQGT